MGLKGIVQLYILLFLTGFTSLAQKGINLQDHILIKESNKYLHGEPEADYEGSPYSNAEFVVGYVNTGAQKFNGVRMRYNIFLDQIEFQDLGVNYVLQPDTLIKKVDIDNETLVVANFKFLNKNIPGFLQVIEGGKLSLLAKKNITYREKVLISDVPAKYIREADTYFYRIENMGLMKVSSLKNFVTSLPDKQEEVIQFLKQEKLSARDKEDLVKLVKFYNSLVASH